MYLKFKSVFLVAMAITTSQAFAGTFGFSIRHLFQPTETQTVTEVEETESNDTFVIVEPTSSEDEIYFYSEIHFLRSLSWDDERNEVLRQFIITHLTTDQLVSILNCYTWDDGKLKALVSIYETLSSASKSKIRKNALPVLNTFVFDSEKSKALKVLLRK